jgi:hypothetical protein
MIGMGIAPTLIVGGRLGGLAAAPGLARKRRPRRRQDSSVRMEATTL